LDWADLNLQDRRQVETWYDALIPKEWKMPTRDVVWVYDLRIPDMDRATQNYVVSELNRQDIAARHGFKPMSSQLEYKRRYDHLNAYRLSREVIYLPVNTAMTKADVEKNVAALIHVVG
jgi:dTDP-4-amino-4,6-dideoxygalactose transaminase